MHSGLAGLPLAGAWPSTWGRAVPCQCDTRGTAWVIPTCGQYVHPPHVRGLGDSERPQVASASRPLSDVTVLVLLRHGGGAWTLASRAEVRARQAVGRIVNVA